MTHSERKLQLLVARQIARRNTLAAAHKAHKNLDREIYLATGKILRLQQHARTEPPQGQNYLYLNRWRGGHRD